MNPLKTNIAQTLKIIILALVLATGLHYVSAASWTPPPNCPSGQTCPPAGNTPAPINEGATTQTKISGLILNGGLTTGLGSPSIGLNVTHGAIIFGSLGTPTPGSSVLMAADSSGTLKWGTVGPGGPPTGDGVGITWGAGSPLSGSLVKIYQSTNPNGSGQPTLTPSIISDDGSHIHIVDGTQGTNKVLTSDGSGTATWQAPQTGGGLSGVSTVTCSANDFASTFYSIPTFSTSKTTTSSSCPSGKSVVFYAQTGGGWAVDGPPTKNTGAYGYITNNGNSITCSITQMGGNAGFAFQGTGWCM